MSKATRNIREERTSDSSLFQLLMFVRVVDNGSFAVAARHAGISASAVSKSIARFEKRHGIRLLHRSTHSLSPTTEGENLLYGAREVLAAFDTLRDTLSRTTGERVAGPVRITAPPGFVRACLAPALPKLLEKYPSLQIDVRSSNRLADLADEAVDLAIRAGPIQNLPGHICQILLSFSWIACAAPDYLSIHGTPSTPEQLSAHRQIGFRNEATGKVVSWRFAPSGHGSDKATRTHVPVGQMIFDDGTTAWDMAKRGQGIVWAPAWLASEDLRNGRMVEVLREWRHKKAPLYLLRRERRLTLPRIAAVIAFMLKAARDWDE